MILYRNTGSSSCGRVCLIIALQTLQWIILVPEGRGRLDTWDKAWLNKHKDGSLKRSVNRMKTISPPAVFSLRCCEIVLWLYSSSVSLFVNTQEGELQDGRFSGYNSGAVKSAATNTIQQPSILKDTEVNRKKFVDRAKRIDTISRAAFPLVFLIFNIFYWITYKIIRHESAKKV